MFLGKVIGTVWSTVKWPQVQGLKLLVVRPYHLADLTGSQDPAQSSAERLAGSPAQPGATPDTTAPNPRGGPDCEAVICVDLLDAGVGDDVVVAFGHAARVAAELRDDAGRQRAGSSSISAPLPATIPPATIPPATIPPATIPPATIPIDAAVVAVVDSIEVARPGT